MWGSAQCQWWGLQQRCTQSVDKVYDKLRQNKWSVKAVSYFQLFLVLIFLLLFVFLFLTICFIIILSFMISSNLFSTITTFITFSTSYNIFGFIHFIRRKNIIAIVTVANTLQWLRKWTYFIFIICMITSLRWRQSYCGYSSTKHTNTFAENHTGDDYLPYQCISIGMNAINGVIFFTLPQTSLIGKEERVGEGYTLWQRRPESHFIVLFAFILTIVKLAMKIAVNLSILLTVRLLPLQWVHAIVDDLLKQLTLQGWWRRRYNTHQANHVFTITLLVQVHVQLIHSCIKAQT